MLPTYRAILVEGNTLRWIDEKPATLEGVEVHVTVLEPVQVPQKRSDGPAMAEALRQIAESGVPSSFGDPLEWERETRQDRVLPGREEE